MKLGVQIPADLLDGEAMREFVSRVEEVGVDSVWLSEHIVVPEKSSSPYPYARDRRWAAPARLPRRSFADPIAAAGFIAGCSRSLKIGVSVFILPLHDPTLLAKALSTLDVVSDGRIIAGIGTGWLEEEFDALAIPFRNRGARCDEHLDVMRALWGPQPVTFNGRFKSFSSVYSEPVPARMGGPPVWIGGVSAAALRRVASRGDGWLALGLSPSEFRAKNEQLNLLLASRGRAPSDVTRAAITPLPLGREATESTPELARLYARAGCEQLICRPVPTEPLSALHTQLEWLATHVLPIARGQRPGSPSDSLPE